MFVEVITPFSTGFTPVVLSTLERRYQLSSTIAGTIVSAYNMTVLFAVVFVSFFGEKGHKPRWLGLGLVIQGCGAIVFALPEFFFGKYSIGRQETKYDHESCRDGHDYVSNCDSGNMFAYCVFLAGSILIGVGATPVFTIGITYLDDIVQPKRVAIHLGLLYAMSVVGPAVGYSVGSGFLSINVDPWESTNLDQHDPGWVGAWWMCFLLAGLVSLLLAVPFLMYPRLLPDSHLVLKARQQEMAARYRNKYDEDLPVLKSFLVHLKRLFTNWPWLFFTLGVSIVMFAFDGMVTFGPKYVETVLSLPVSYASAILGTVGKTYTIGEVLRADQ